MKRARRYVAFTCYHPLDFRKTAHRQLRNLPALGVQRPGLIGHQTQNIPRIRQHHGIRLDPHCTRVIQHLPARRLTMCNRLEPRSRTSRL